MKLYFAMQHICPFDAILTKAHNQEIEFSFKGGNHVTDRKSFIDYVEFNRRLDGRFDVRRLNMI